MKTHYKLLVAAAFGLLAVGNASAQKKLQEAGSATAHDATAYNRNKKMGVVALRTNVLYDAFLLPTLGVEWRINPVLGVKLDGSLACWGSGQGKTMKMWFVNPEVRWYLLRDRRFYTGISGNFGKYNLYKYPLGSLFSSDTGYQGKMWGAGLTVGYQLGLSRSFSLDFNLGLGYVRSDYDSFGMIDGVRVYKEKDQSKNFFGPTQVGINLIWTIGGHK